VSWIVSHLAIILSGLGVTGLTVLGFMFPQIAAEIVTGLLNIAGRFLKQLDMQGWVGLVSTLLALTWGVHGAMDARHWKKLSDNYEKLYNQDHLAFGLTVLNYRTAAAKQKADDDAKNARTVASQQAASQETIDEYQARLAAARAEYQRLQSSAANPGGGAGTGVPSLPAPPSGPPQSTADGLSLRYTCTAQGLQLDELIKWVTRQHAIDPNKE
jgi:hypothetical protein